VTAGTASDIELYNSLHEGRHRFKQWPIWLWCLKRRPAGGQLGLLVAAGQYPVVPDALQACGVGLHLLAKLCHGYVLD
jgi:hypothetical protein